MPPHRPEIGRLWASEWSLTAMLGLLVVLIFFVHPLIGLGYDLGPVASATFTLALFSGVMAVAHSQSTRLLFGALAVLAIAVHCWVRYSALGAEWPGADAFATFAACGMLATIVFVQVYRPGPITHDRIQGAIAGYLLIAVMFATAYVWIDLRSPGAFAGAGTSVERDQRTARLLYFSLTTLTTVGYGDITPVQPFARSLAMLEALVGQIFPAILLARLVSQQASERERRRAGDDHR